MEDIPKTRNACIGLKASEWMGVIIGRDEDVSMFNLAIWIGISPNEYWLCHIIAFDKLCDSA